MLKPLRWGAWIVTLAFWLSCVLAPLLSVGWAGVFGADSQQIWKSFSDPTTVAVVRVTFFQAVISTLISVAVGTPLGLWISGNRVAQFFLALPFGVPTVVAALAWTSWLGRSGALSFLGWSYSLKAVILAHVFFNAPWVALWVAQSRAQIPVARIEAARTLGATRFSRFSFVYWPAVKGAVATASAQVLAFCAMSFALVLVLGGGPPVQTLETALFSRIRMGALDVTGALAFAIWQVILTLGPFLFLMWISARSQRELLDQPQVVRKSQLKIASAAFFLVPYLIFIPQVKWRLFADADFWSVTIDPLLISLKLACFSATLTTLLAAAAVWVLKSLRRPTLEVFGLSLLSLSSGLSVLVLGLGFWLSYGRWVDPFEGSWLAMVALQVALFFPLALRVLWPVAQSSQRVRIEAAAVLGAGPFKAFWFIEWPRWKMPVVSVLGMVAGASIGEVAAVSLFYSESMMPLPLLVTRWMGQYRFDEAMAIAALLFLVSGGLMAIFWRIQNGQKKGEVIRHG